MILTLRTEAAIGVQTNPVSKPARALDWAPGQTVFTAVPLCEAAQQPVSCPSLGAILISPLNF